MKNKTLFFAFIIVLVFGVLVSCGGMSSLIPSALIPSNPTKGIPKTPLARQAQATQTLGITATPTPDWQAAYSVAATNERGAQVQLEAVNVEIARITEQAKQQEIDLLSQKNEADRLLLADKQASILATQTAFPALATEQNDRREDQIRLQIEQSKADSARPTLTWANANSETYAKNADRIKAAELGIQWVVIALGVAFTIFLLFVSTATLIRASRPAPVVQASDSNAKSFEPIPQRVDKANQNVTHLINPVIPCSTDQLLFLADWISVKGYGLTLKPLENSPIYKRMVGKYNMRGWLVTNDLAYESPSNTGEVFLNEKGRDFFADANNMKAAPMFDGVQYSCRDIDTTEEKQ